MRCLSLRKGRVVAVQMPLGVADEAIAPARLASSAAPPPMDDVPADFTPFVGSGPSATLEALRALAAEPKAAIPGLVKDGCAAQRTARPQREAQRRTDRRPKLMGA